MSQDSQNVLKRDGRIVIFDSGKVFNAMLSAYSSLHDTIDREYVDVCNDAINAIIDEYDSVGDNTLSDNTLSVEDIQDIVEETLLDSKYNDVAKAYILYRDERTRCRETTIDRVVSEILEDSNEYWSTENSNKDSKLLTTQRDYMAGAISTDIMRRKILPKHLIEAHDIGILHIHDCDYISMKMYNCCLINLEDMLQNGTVISNVQIDKPHKFSTACNIASQVIAQVASSQFGGQSISLSHVSPFVEETRKTFKKKYPSASDELIESMVRDDIRAGIQTLQYQVLTLMTTNGQAPFLTVFMNLTDVDGSQRDDLALCIQEMLEQRILGVKNDKGVYVSPSFPKLIYALDECNITEDSPYFYLTQLSAVCSAKRLVPDYVSTKVIKQLKRGDVFPPMGCRSFLSVDTATENLAKAHNWDRHKYHKYYGRFNLGVVTLNLVDVALSAKGDMTKFWDLMEERSELVHEAQLIRYHRLKGTKSDVAPILWQYGAIARLGKGEVIDRLLLKDYATISFGYGGLYECCMAMLGESNTTERGQQFSKDVLQFINKKCDEWSTTDNLGFSPYGTPMESLTYRFAKTLRKRFGVIKDITDHDYITNSFHVNVREHISAFDKIAIESQFQELSLGGSIIYTEVPNMNRNIEAVVQLLQYMYEHSMYSEINTKSDYCSKCGFDGEIQIKGEEGHLYWECPQCGNTDTALLHVTRRTCGYLGSNFWNQGRTEEIRDRVLHLD